MKKPAKRKPPFLSACTVNFAVCKPLDFIGENPEAPPVADKARDLSEQIQSDATRSKRAARQYLRGGNTGTPFFKTAPNFDFYFFGGYFLVCAIIIAQIAEQRFLLSREAAPVSFQTQLPSRFIRL